MADRLLLVTSPLLRRAGRARGAAAARTRSASSRGRSTASTGRRPSGPCGRSRRRRASAADGVVGPDDAEGARRSAAAGAARREAPSGGGRSPRRGAGSGRREDPPGSNRTPFGVWFGLDGVPWCNIFVSYCFAVGAGYTIAAGFHGAGCYGDAAAPTSRPPRRGSGRRACGSAASQPSPATSRSTTGTAARPTTSGSSRDRRRRRLHRDRGQHRRRQRLERRRGDAPRAHPRRRRRLRPRSHFSERPANPPSQTARPSISGVARQREERRRRTAKRRRMRWWKAALAWRTAGRRRGAGVCTGWRSAASRHAASARPRARSFTGYAFDACNAPKIDALTAWLESPYRALGIYIGGVEPRLREHRSSPPTGPRPPSRPAGA